MNVVSRSVLALVVLAVALMPAALTAAQDENPLMGTRWQLLHIRELDALFPVLESPITLLFDEEGRAGGSAGCNTYGSAYIVDADSITFETPFSTMMACPQSIMDLESQYLTALSSATRYEIIDGQLHITFGEEQELVFAPLTSITDGEWQLLYFRELDALTPVVEGSTVTFLMNEEESSVGGSTGCNRYGGGYTLEGDALTLTEMFTTEMACLEEGLMAQERAFLDALATVSRYEIVEGQLVLYYGEEQALVFEAVMTVIGNEWQLESFVTGDAASSLVADSAITLTLNEDGSAGGRACNTYRTSYTMDGDAITFSPIVSTRMACAPEVMTQESAYFTALGAATRYEIVEGKLIIEHPEGQLVFSVAQSSAQDSE